MLIVPHRADRPLAIRSLTVAALIGAGDSRRTERRLEDGGFVEETAGGEAVET